MIVWATASGTDYAHVELGNAFEKTTMFTCLYKRIRRGKFILKQCFYHGIEGLINDAPLWNAYNGQLQPHQFLLGWRFTWIISIRADRVWPLFWIGNCFLVTGQVGEKVVNKCGTANWGNRSPPIRVCISTIEQWGSSQARVRRTKLRLIAIYSSRDTQVVD